MIIDQFKHRNPQVVVERKTLPPYEVIITKQGEVYYVKLFESARQLSEQGPFDLIDALTEFHLSYRNINEEKV